MTISISINVENGIYKVNIHNCGKVTYFECKDIADLLNGFLPLIPILHEYPQTEYIQPVITYGIKDYPSDKF
jgi:hypothetical protein